MAASHPRLLSAIKPTGELHLGNYFGAMQQFVELQSQYESFVFIADYHALTTNHDAASLREQSHRIAAAYLAIGLDPESVTLFRQSDIPEHTELAWIFNCITNMGYLERSHAYKDAKANQQDVSVGTFDYPMLMAADILMYDTDVVPVGSDQKQHIEFARDTAQKFNSTFGETFSEPEPLILETGATVPGTDGRKMSKSYKNTIPLFGNSEDIQKAVAGIVTDSKGVNDPKETAGNSLYELLALLRPEQKEEITDLFTRGGVGYGDLKNRLSEAIDEYFGGMRESYTHYIENREEVDAVLEAGAQRARDIAKQKMANVRECVGVRNG